MVLNLNMTTPTQCGHSVVQWSGDSGPYHLLLTPTSIQQHSYNVWVPSIPDGTNSYNLSINQPSGLNFIVTMWGQGGISQAGTTDIFTVDPSLKNDSSCFLTDSDILSLYTFSFNITTPTYFPPQCSNMSMTWPTSLESNVTGGLVKRDTTVFDEFDDMPSPEFEMFDTSSSSDTGNTTNPPTMFGIIPLGNSFSIPITYSHNSRFAKKLPATSLSDTPTTSTSQGLTTMNWTIDLAKGTRFLLVAGVGSDEQWASGGSSAMITVGQGNTGCVGSEQSGGGAPSITATGTGDPAITATSIPDNGSAGAAANGLTKTVVASVISVIGTLVFVGLIFLILRIRKRRRQAALLQASNDPSHSNSNGKSGFKALIGRNASTATRALRTDTQLDLISSRDGYVDGEGDGDGNRDRDSRGGGGISPTVLTGLVGPGGMITESPADSPIGTEGNSNPFRDPLRALPPYLATRGDTTMTSTTNTSTPSPTSPSGTFSPGRYDPRSDEMIRQRSTDALLGGYAAGNGIGYLPPSRLATPFENQGDTSHLYTSGGQGQGRGHIRGPLTLHERFDNGDDDAEDDGDMSDLKRDTLSYLGESSNSTSITTQTTPISTHPPPLPYAVTNPDGDMAPASNAQSNTNTVPLPNNTNLRARPSTTSLPNTQTPGRGQGQSQGQGQGQRRRRRIVEEETSYVVHRDAGPVVELPPRYDQLNYASGGDGGGVGGDGSEDRVEGDTDVGGARETRTT